MCDPNDEAKPNPAPQNDPETSEVSNNVTKAGEDPKTSVAPNTTEQDTAAQTPVPQKRSWMQMWGGSNVNKLKEDSQIDPSSEEPVAEQDQPSDQPVVAPPTNESSVVEDSQERKRDSGPSKSSGWAFWSRDVPNTGTQPAAQQEESGELILSEQILSKTNKDDSVPQPELKSILSSPKAENKKRIKTVPPTNTVNGKATKTTGPITEDGVTSIPTDDAIATPIPAKVKSQEVTASKQLQSVLSNQLLPAFKDTFALQESASWLQTLGRLLHYTKQPENQHVFVLRDPPLFKKALAIGVHGYFPAPYLRTVLGQPTGTSLKFSTMAAKAIHRWAESHGYHCDVEKISLEGEGRIAERVDLLWKLLLNWMEDIRRAEFIMFACHSQGVPVTIMLVAKLIAFGCLDASRVGICAMAGVNQGPFPDYKSRWIGGSAGELFDFANPTTKVSKDYEMALKTCLEFGVRITYVGSIDDQLVSLEVCCLFCCEGMN
ncbi:hypothetical protein BGW36DRAFT_6738 [Talaromyces proteolyticus]|uniref:YMC020W-like alpha/beta hydrolase domain-containing protein n=1 Tax=Talaromyces proteolyticus TaxID=1131652 RepID=A0AAD4Q105_9EURO|nr:uncharacterized protein BGW36DRAFT_6738 [Talaromyces proteolyticus]KAH8705085.1 hypothetical protein BGW36DRAFT_6738 [Talaromyces proteolyticus]